MKPTQIEQLKNTKYRSAEVLAELLKEYDNPKATKRVLKYVSSSYERIKALDEIKTLRVYFIQLAHQDTINSIKISERFPEKIEKYILILICAIFRNEIAKDIAKNKK